MQRSQFIFALSWVLVSLGLLGACSTPENHFVVRPPDRPSDDKTENKTDNKLIGTELGRKSQSEGFYPEPADAPIGNVRVRALGLVDLRLKGGNERIPALHVRMTIAKTAGSEPWSIRASEQELLFLNSDKTSPLYANSNGTALTQMTVQTGELRALDLYFRLPEKSKSDPNLQEFDFKWSVHSGANILANTTIFERSAAPSPQMAPYPYGYPYDPYPVGPVWYGGEMAAPIRIRN